MTEREIPAPGPQTPPPDARGGTIEVLGTRIAVWDRPGAGAPLILVHGNLASKAAFRPLFAARDLADRRLIAFDLPGCGDSADAAEPQDTYTMPGLARAIIGVAAALDLAPPVILGWSLGGHAAIETLVQGGRPRGLILTGTPPCGPARAEIEATFNPLPAAAVMGLERPDDDQVADFLRLAYGPEPPDAEARAAAHRADGRLRARLFEHLYTIGGPAHRGVIAAWTGPVAVLQGDGEPFFDPALIDRLAWANLWRGRSQTIPNAGHAPFRTAPDAYAALVRAFLTDIGA